MKCCATTNDKKPSVPITAGAVYTCPIHPQIRQDKPGNCSICGMALEPVSNPELKNMT